MILGHLLRAYIRLKGTLKMQNNPWFGTAYTFLVSHEISLRPNLSQNDNAANKNRNCVAGNHLIFLYTEASVWLPWTLVKAQFQYRLLWLFSMHKKIFILWLDCLTFLLSNLLQMMYASTWLQIVSSLL